MKKSVPLTLVRLAGEDENAPGMMSLTITVPAAVPSLFHNSVPKPLANAVKNSVPFTSTRLDGLELRRTGARCP